MDKATVASLKILENLDWGWDLTGVRGPTGVGARRVSGPDGCRGPTGVGARRVSGPDGCRGPTGVGARRASGPDGYAPWLPEGRGEIFR